MNILITGGASGLGKAITYQMAKEASNIVYFTYSNSIDSANEITKILPNTRAIKCDFSTPLEVTSLADIITKENIEVLINNAYVGAFLKSHFQKIDAIDFSNDFRNNIIPTIEITQAFIKKCRKKKFGKIITILTSALINTPPIGAAVYVANKAYLAQLTKVWAVENIKFNITSNSISPSFMQTNLTADMDNRMVEQIEQNHPLKKILTVEEVAESVVWLINASNHINGVDLPINAGVNIS